MIIGFRNGNLHPTLENICTNPINTGRVFRLKKSRGKGSKGYEWIMEGDPEFLVVSATSEGKGK